MEEERMIKSEGGGSNKVKDVAKRYRRGRDNRRQEGRKVRSKAGRKEGEGRIT